MQGASVQWVASSSKRLAFKGGEMPSLLRGAGTCGGGGQWPQQWHRLLSRPRVVGVVLVDVSAHRSPRRLG